MKDWFKKIFKKKEGQTIEKARENEDNCPDCVCFGGDDRHGVDCVEKDEKLEKYLSCLGEHEAEVIKWRFGFNDYKYHTLKDIAEKLGIAPQKVRDIETIAIAKLKIMMKEGA